MKYIQLFLSFSRSRQIAISVCLAHLLVVIGLIGHHLITRRPSPPRPIVVRTVVPKAVAPVQLETKQKPAPSTVPVVKKETPKKEPKKEIAKAKPKPAPETKKPALEKSLAQPVQEKDPLLEEIAQRLEALAAASEPPRFRPSLSLPSEVEPKAKVTESSNENPVYGEILIAYLQNALDLPEFGEVKAKLDIDRFGRLIDFEILETKSVKNAEFLKNRLPELALPCFNEADSSNTNLSFTITFRNVEIR